jgi:tetratricopeptide (TPR) repeat protein
MASMQHPPSPHSAQMRRNLIFSALSVLLLFVACGGAWYLREGRKDALSDTMEQMAAQQQKVAASASGSYLASKLAAQQGNTQEALQHLSRTMTLKQADDQLLRQAYRLSILSGAFEQAEIYADKLSQQRLDPLLNPHLLKAVLAIKNNQFALAAERLEKMPPEGANALFLPLVKGWVQLGLGKTFPEESILRSVAQAGQFTPLLKYQAALLLDAAGKKQEAARYYQEITADETFSYRIAMVLANFYQRSGDKHALKQVLNRYQQHYSYPLPEITSKPLVSSPAEGVAEIFYGISSVLFGLEAYKEAEVPLQLALKLNPQLDAAKFLQANLLEKLERCAEANLIYRQFAEHPVLALQSGIRQSYCEQDLSQPKQAMNTLEQLAQRYPEDADVLLAQADLLRVEKHYPKAAKVYTAALRLLGEKQEKHWQVYYLRGICLERTQQWEKAEADFLEALRLHPDQPDVLNYLGYSWLIQGKHLDRASDMIEKAMLARPQDAHIVDSMGWAMYQLGRYQDALKYMEQAANLAPRDPTVNEHLGDVYWQLGYPLQAKYQWERALLFEPEEEGQADGLKQKIAEGLQPDATPAAAGQMTQNATPDLNTRP